MNRLLPLSPTDQERPPASWVFSVPGQFQPSCVLQRLPCVADRQPRKSPRAAGGEEKKPVTGHGGLLLAAHLIWLLQWPIIWSHKICAVVTCSAPPSPCRIEDRQTELCVCVCVFVNPANPCWVWVPRGADSRRFIEPLLGGKSPPKP